MTPSASVAAPGRSGLGFSLSYYRPGEDHPRHAHDFTQVSFVLGGEMQEFQSRRDFEVAAGGVGVKPAGQAHADRWGRHGALIFSLRVEDAELEADLEARAGWRASAAPLGALIRACREAPAEAREDAALDLIAAVGSVEAKPITAPPWMARARDEMRESEHHVPTTLLARRAGVGRVHFSRLFHRCFGCPPSVFRRRVMAARAIAGAIDGRHSLTAIAHAAGFSDQAHMSRVLRLETGLTPGGLRAALAQATSVQARGRPAP